MSDGERWTLYRYGDFDWHLKNWRALPVEAETVKVMRVSEHEEAMRITDEIVTQQAEALHCPIADAIQREARHWGYEIPASVCDLMAERAIQARDA